MSCVFSIDLLPDFAKGILHKIRMTIPQGRYLVGGIVRDVFLNRVNEEHIDFDIISPSPYDDAIRLSNLFRAKIVVLDEEQKIYRVAIKKNISIDIAGIVAGNLKQDLLRRDFTINAIAVSLEDNSIFDPFSGISDIGQKILRCVRRKNLQEDPIRILRAFSFSSVLGFKWDNLLQRAVLNNIQEIRRVKPERIQIELVRLFSGEFICEMWRKMYDLGLLGILFPEIKSMEGVYQGPYHHLDVLGHSFLTMEKMKYILDNLKFISRLKKRKDIEKILFQNIGNWSIRNLLLWVSFWHDVGKPDARKQIEEKIVFYGHENIGANLLRNIMKRMRFSNSQTNFATDLVKLHLRPGVLTEGEATKKAVLRLFRRSDDKIIPLLLLSWADAWATRGKLSPWRRFYQHRKGIIFLLDEAMDFLEKRDIKRFVSGYDVMKILGIRPSPLVGRILDEIYELQLLGKLRNRDEALAYLEGLKKDVIPELS